jgi:BASS family bile acid:Na+ symporter
MPIDKLINILITITLFEMMVAIGLSVRFAEIREVAGNRRLVTRAVLANYVIVPIVVLGLLFLFHPDPLVAAGFLIVAVCPGAPYGPPFTAIAKGNVSAAVGLMVILAGSSAVLAPALLYFLLPLMGGATLRKGIYAFIFDQKGLMAGIGLQGSKMTRITPDE